jgi:hypothetical protein
MCSLPADRHRRAGLLGRAAVYPFCAAPDPEPAVSGYHEVFPLLVIAGIAAPFLAISLFALPHRLNPPGCGPCCRGGPPTVVGRRDAARLRRR